MESPTTTSLPTGGPTAGGDEFDDLFDYDVDGENDPFSANYKVPGTKDTTKDAANASAGKGDGNLGIDEEIEVTRKPRAPRVKLDEQRLLSANGIPKLRKKAKDHLKLKGKGHEYSDASRLLAFYQLWLDDLFPKARFLDALAMVEKMGHKKVLQVARMEWIDEGKPRSADPDDTIYDDPIIPTRENGDRETTASRIAPIFEKAATARPKTPTMDVDDMDMDDLYDATPKPAAVAAGQSSIFGGSAANTGSKQTSNNNDEMDDDDLDALLAEEDAMRNTVPSKKQPKPIAKPTGFEEGMDEDDLDALLAEEDAMQNTFSSKTQPPTTKPKPTGVDGEMDEDDLDALLAEEDAIRTAPTAPKPTATVPKPKPVVDDFDDEMEAMAGMW